VSKLLTIVIILGLSLQAHANMSCREFLSSSDKRLVEVNNLEGDTHIIGQKNSPVYTNDFTVNRGLKQYLTEMGAMGEGDTVGVNSELPAFMANLPPGTLVIDGGAGQALFETQYQLWSRGIDDGDSSRAAVQGKQLVRDSHIQLNPNLRMTAVSFKKPDLPAATQKAIDLCLLTYVESDIVLFAQKPENQGKAQLIVDFYGVLQYVDFPTAIEAYAKLLAPGGRVYFQAVQGFSLQIKDVISFLSTCKGIRWISSEKDTSLPVFGKYGYFERSEEPLEFRNKN
jgi:hypothetical protein